MKVLVKLIIPALLICSCGPQERVSKEVFEAVNEKMEVKKLSDFEIVQEAMVWGDSIATEAQVQLISNLQKAIADKGVDGAVEFCNVNATSLLNEVAEKYNVSIRRASNRYRNPADQPNEDEQPLLEAYEYNAENGIKSEPSIQKIENGDVLLYTKAIVIPGAFCLSCHGDPSKEIDSKTLQKIDSIYPNDKAKGHQIGDLRGMWSIRIPKKEVVNRL
ncbi:MAG: DUF3365 domain-containing protein [Algoriphagus sp.]|uniref:Tll0287-like domain-containing protein n=1 Tax=Algoriphagus sp. TaxID=1872435 RepID=UPI002609E9A5|nr:DUF3365 domain-containing protein [Algoriphagus sp.]MDG1277088.1 DUF3365 domain-containing protein [Algoriphagus sp.]